MPARSFFSRVIFPNWWQQQQILEFRNTAERLPEKSMEPEPFVSSLFMISSTSITDPKSKPTFDNPVISSSRVKTPFPSLSKPLNVFKSSWRSCSTEIWFAIKLSNTAFSLFLVYLLRRDKKKIRWNSWYSSSHVMIARLSKYCFGSKGRWRPPLQKAYSWDHKWGVSLHIL